MEDKKISEKEFQKYVSWKIPPFIKLVWIILISWMVIYTLLYLLPDLKWWLAK